MAAIEPDPGWGDDGLASVIDECAACVAGEADCDFHAGFVAGWDACAAAVAAHLQSERLAELVPAGDDIGERRS